LGLKVPFSPFPLSAELVVGIRKMNAEDADRQGQGDNPRHHGEGGNELAEGADRSDVTIPDSGEGHKGPPEGGKNVLEGRLLARQGPGGINPLANVLVQVADGVLCVEHEAGEEDEGQGEHEEEDVDPLEAPLHRSGDQVDRLGGFPDPEHLEDAGQAEDADDGEAGGVLVGGGCQGNVKGEDGHEVDEVKGVKEEGEEARAGGEAQEVLEGEVGDEEGL